VTGETIETFRGVIGDNRRGSRKNDEKPATKPLSVRAGSRKVPGRSWRHNRRAIATSITIGTKDNPLTNTARPVLHCLSV
jgi:hypothetical protein